MPAQLQFPARSLGKTGIPITPIGLGMMEFSGGGGLLGKIFPAYTPLVEAREAIGASHNATAAQVALNWVISVHGDTIVTIPGATKVRQAEEAAGAMTFRLAGAELSRLNELSAR